jgi:predicted nucleic acid-binding Zn ribbon protein
MPTYVYKFLDREGTIEVQQAFSDNALTEAVHPDDGQLHPVKKVFTPVGVSFKGNGFYKTDSRGSKSSSSSSSSSKSENGSSNGSSASDSGGGSDSSSSSTPAATTTPTSSSTTPSSSD